MKTIILHIFAIVFPAILLTMNSAGAGERVRVFEMGEGGFMIEFPMTPDEIAVQDAAYDRIIVAGQSYLGKICP